ncbi:MAG TPA: efflux RND transporter permease subunit, partial [Thermoanaerobaculia bacterium]|nr:efflux RND transporter permease subunit [Thermoanaerobaculia bacterium]
METTTARRVAGASAEVVVWGAGEYSLRIWLDPDKVAARQMTATDVLRALREQNVQVAAGVLGQPTGSGGGGGGGGGGG